ncbi:putative odorant receptor 67d [Lucilia cuprina]|uniref:Putative odorant receptor 67d n=1 Tax=Lucilia cuprina TaxID=7375 RepID=A0A0L0BQX2_LUCCU|nr:putative odorant receptor 67d [Lucilia cuprina]
MSVRYSEKFVKIFDTTRRFAMLCGVDVLNENFKMCWKTLAIFLLINFAIAFTFYTNYVEAFVKDNIYNILKSTSILGTGLQGYTKFINVLKQQENFRFLYHDIEEMYKTYELKSLAYRNCLNSSISLANKLLAILLTLITVTALIVVGVPVLILIFRGTRIEIMPFHIPYIDIDTDFGYYFTLVVHIVAVFFGGFGNFVIDSWLFVFTAHIPLKKNILKCKLDDLDKILEEHPRNLEKTKEPLSDIFKWHQKYLHFSNVIKDSYYWVIFVQVSTEFFGIISTIVCMFLGIWPPAPAYLLYLFAMFYSYCSLGNIVEVSNDEVIFIIYDCCWYKLTSSQQKMVLIMLRESQQATGFSIGGVAPLSMNDDYRMTWATWYVIHLLNAAIGFTIYTVYVGMVNENDWTLPLKCLCMFCTDIQGYAKLINAIQKQQLYRFIHKEIIGIYTVYEQRKNYHKLLKESISLVKTLLNILLAIVILVTLSIIGVPIFYNLVFNERIFIMQFFFPYINYNTNFGYYLTSTFHVICVLFGGFGNFISDTWCFMFAAHIPLIKNILLAKFKELNELLEKDPLECVEIKNKLSDIFQWHQKYLVFLLTVVSIFKKMTTTRYSTQFQRFFNYTRFFSQLCGVDVVLKNYRMTTATWIVIALINIAIGFTFYTMYVGVIINNDWIIMLKSLCMLGTGVQGYAKIINALKKSHIYHIIYEEIVEMYTVYEENKCYHKLLKESLALIKKLIAILFGVVILTVLSVIGVPIIYRIAFKERIFVMHFFFPYIDTETNFGYYLTTTFHIICVFFGGFGNFINDSWCFIFAAHIPLIKNILQAKFRELDILLQKDPLEFDEIKNKLLDIFKWHQKFILKFGRNFGNSYLKYTICVLFKQILLLQNDDVVFMIYDSDWYKLNVSQQKMILIMLRESQEAEGMSIGGVAPLTLNTALQLTKTIYTFSMMLRNFLN